MNINNVPFKGNPYKKIAVHPPYQRWTKPEIKAELRNISANNLPYNHKIIHAYYQTLLRKGITFFGSWRDTIIASGLQPPPLRGNRLERQETVKLIGTRIDAGLPVGRAFMLHYYPDYINIATDNSPSKWIYLLKKAHANSLAMEKESLAFKKFALIKNIAKVIRESEDLTSSSIHRKAAQVSYETLRNYFGGWKKALEKTLLFIKNIYDEDYEIKTKAPKKKTVQIKLAHTLSVIRRNIKQRREVINIIKERVSMNFPIDKYFMRYFYKDYYENSRRLFKDHNWNVALKVAGVSQDYMDKHILSFNKLMVLKKLSFIPIAFGRVSEFNAQWEGYDLFGGKVNAFKEAEKYRHRVFDE